jgi:hypothetical protein
MVGDIADMIRKWLFQSGVEMIGASGESGRGSIRVLVQFDVRMAKLAENLGGSAVRPTPQRFSNNFIPQVAKFVLQFRSGIAYVELGK